MASMSDGGVARRSLLGALAAPATAGAQGTASSERFPVRPITIYVPFTAGGATDVQMRALAEAATRRFDRPC